MKMVVVILFLTIISSLLMIGAKSASPVVLDTKGDPVLYLAEYYIWPIELNNSSPITFQSRTSMSCPVYLGLGPNITSALHTVRFYPSNNDIHLRQDTNFFATFNDDTKCDQVLRWKVESPISITDEKRAIGLGLDETNGDSNQFKINALPGINSGYVIYWCPCEFMSPVYCSLMGVEAVNGKNMLTLDGYGIQSYLPVKFERVFNFPNM